jgi:hypothetical protein
MSPCNVSGVGGVDAVEPLPGFLALDDLHVLTQNHKNTKHFRNGVGGFGSSARWIPTWFQNMCVNGWSLRGS